MSNDYYKSRSPGHKFILRFLTALIVVFLIAGTAKLLSLIFGTDMMDTFIVCAYFSFVLRDIKSELKK